MSDAVDEFLKLTGKRTKQRVDVQTAYATCKTVDWENKTMTAVGQSDNLPYYKVKLGLGSVVKKPIVDTLCLIGLIENQPANSFLIDCVEFEAIEIEDSTGLKFNLNHGEMSIKDGNNYEIKLAQGILTLNGDEFSGLVKADELKTQIDKNTAILQSLQNAIQSWVPVPEDGGAAFKAQLASVPNMQRANLGSIKNNKIKHG